MVRWAHIYLRSASKLVIGSTTLCVDEEGFVSTESGDDPPKEVQDIMSANPEFKKVTVAAPAKPPTPAPKAEAKAQESAPAAPEPEPEPKAKPKPKQASKKKAPAKKKK